MRLGCDVHKQVDDALRDIDANAIGMVVRNGQVALSALGLAYAHRFIMVAVQRELVLGGATRTLFKSMTIPTLMSH